MTHHHRARRHVHYRDKHAVRNVSLDIGRNQVLALIGPSGCGKSTFLRCLNRMNDTIPSARVDGLITLDDRIFTIENKTSHSCGRAWVSCFRSHSFSAVDLCDVAYGPRIQA